MSASALYGVMAFAGLLLLPAISPFVHSNVRVPCDGSDRARRWQGSIAERKTKAALELRRGKEFLGGELTAEVNTHEYVHILSRYPWTVPPTLGLMMIGLSLFKSGFLAGRASTKRYATVVAAGTVALAIVARMAWRKDVAEMPFLGEDAVGFLLTPAVSLAYASTLILLLRSGAVSLLLPVCGLAGRMAFH